MYRSALLLAGLGDDEAEVYEALLMGGPRSAGDLLKKLKGMKRGTLYQVLARLSEKRLVKESKRKGAAVFSPEPPDTLVDMLRSAEEDVARRRSAVEGALPEMRAKFRVINQRPAIRYFEGAEGLRRIYEEHITSPAKELYFVRTGKAALASEHMGKWWAHYLRRRKEKGMVSHAIAPDDPVAIHDPRRDALFGIVRTWVRPSDYSAPIEIDVYGDTVAVISFGEEIFGLAISNADIAKAFLDVFRLAERGAGTIEVKHDHPDVPSTI